MSKNQPITTQDMQKALERYGLETDEYAITLYQHAVLNPSDEIPRNIFSEYIDLHPHVQLRRLNNNAFDAPPNRYEETKSITLGTNEYGEEAPLPLSHLEGHALIAGGAGTGKTTTIRNTLMQLHKHGKHFLHIDFKRDGRSLQPHIDNLIVLTVSETPNFVFNPLELWPGTSPKNQDHLLIDILCRAYFGAQGTRSILRKATDRLRNSHKEFTIAHLCNSVRNWKVGKSFREQEWYLTANRCLEVFEHYASVVDCLRGVPLWEVINNHNVVIELDQIVDTNDLSFFTDLFTGLYLNYKRCTNQRKD